MRKEKNELALPDSKAVIVESVKNWILEGQSMHNILTALKENEVSMKEVPEILESAQSEWRSLAKVDSDEIKGFARAASMHLYKKMVEIGDYANALRALKELSKL